MQGIDASREATVLMGGYIKEMKFFESLSKEMSFMRTPRVYAVFKDKDRPEEYFCIVRRCRISSIFAVSSALTQNADGAAHR